MFVHGFGWVVKELFQFGFGVVEGNCGVRINSKEALCV